jgi:hypothetical protein
MSRESQLTHPFSQPLSDQYIFRRYGAGKLLINTRVHPIVEQNFEIFVEHLDRVIKRPWVIPLTDVFVHHGNINIMSIDISIKVKLSGDIWSPKETLLIKFQTPITSKIRGYDEVGFLFNIQDLRPYK